MLIVTGNPLSLCHHLPVYCKAEACQNSSVSSQSSSVAHAMSIMCSREVIYTYSQETDSEQQTQQYMSGHLSVCSLLLLFLFHQQTMRGVTAVPTLTCEQSHISHTDHDQWLDLLVSWYFINTEYSSFRGHICPSVPKSRTYFSLSKGAYR